MERPRDTDGTWLLTEADREILARLASGDTVEVIARHVRMSERTVRRRLRSMAEELGVDTTIEVVVRAVRQRLI